MASMDTRLLFIAATLTFLAARVNGSSVTSITPHDGSISGGTRLTIHGEGFSPDPFNYGEGNEDKGNQVFLKSAFKSYPCDVIPYFSNQDKIVCDTRALGQEGDDFEVSVIVDGTAVSQYCSRSSNCQFDFEERNTPEIRSVTPSSGLPGTKLKVRGRIFTDIYDPSRVLEDEDEQYEGQSQILRVFWGNYACDPLDPATGEPYNIALDAATSQEGVIECVPKGTFIASQTASFLVSDEYGRSWNERNALHVSGRNQLYHFQSHADVLDVEPKVGSTAGGTILTITGQYFDERDTVVLVGGVPCDIFDISTTTIQCTTRPVPPRQSVYPGERGMMYEVWKDTSVGFADFDWTDNATDYSIVSDASSPDEHLSGESESFAARLSGYFVPPYTGEYTFHVRGDDNAELWMRNISNDSSLVKIAEVKYTSSSWFPQDSQSSDYFSLTENQSYYMEARHMKTTQADYVQIAAHFFDVPLSNYNTSDATNEVQEITTTSVVHRELQTLTIEGDASYEVQEICFELPLCPSNVSEDCMINSTYRLQLDSQVTDEINITASAEEVENALNAILGAGSVAVNKTEEENNTACYLVKFHLERVDLPLLVVLQDDLSLLVSVSQISAYVPATLDKSFSLVYDGITSVDLSSSSTDLEVQDALLEIFSVKCATSTTVKGFYAQDFEGENLGYINGEVINDEEPYCGRWSVKNPDRIFYGGRTLKPGTNTALDSFDVRNNPMMCFGHRGAIRSITQFYIRWVEDATNENRASWITFDIPTITVTASWTFVCVDIYALVEASSIFTRHKVGFPLEIAHVRLFRENDDDFYIDNFFIGSSIPQYQRLQPAARPNGIFVTDAAVTKGTNSFNITLTPSKCGHGFPLIGIQRTDIVYTTSDNQTAHYRNATWPGNMLISVSRIVSATPPIGGTFTVDLYGQTLTVPAQATADKLKEILQANLDIGSLDVFRTGSCTGYSWEVEWTSKGGRQPLMEVNGSGLMGNEPHVWSHRNEEGRLFIGPITGEFLRVPHVNPQVQVTVNSIPSSCSLDQCMFKFSDVATPTIDSASPSSGSAYNDTVLMLTGSGFATVAGDNRVTIGGVECDVLSSSEMSISCTIPAVTAGVYPVVLDVAGKGLATYPNGDITFHSELGIRNVTPSSGSTAGGTHVTVSGYGFGSKNDSIFMGSRQCIITASMYDVIECSLELDAMDSSRKRRSTTVDLIIIVGNEMVTAEGVFTFDPSLTPTITSFSPNVSSVLGGGVLIIYGSGFGDGGAVVIIGQSECAILGQSDMEINCTIPEHAPGIYDIKVVVTDQGFADTNGLQFRYDLEVTGLFPDRGSIRGGTVLTITGSGFGSSMADTTARLDDKVCDVTAVGDDTIVCRTTSSEGTHLVNNLGKHESYGIGYKWNPQVLTVTAGDEVFWQWFSPMEVTGIGYAVQQTEDSDSVGYDGQGFISGAKTAQGTFGYKFSSPGIYYYSSGPVDDGDQLYLKGTIIVKEPTFSSHKLIVEVSSYQALHDPQSGVTDPMNPDPCPGSDTAIPSCNTPLDPVTEPSSFYFAYWICSTPVIETIDPNIGTPGQLITITGSGFSDELCENQITVGDYACAPQSANGIFLTCLVDAAGSMPVGQPLALSLTVLNRGLALNRIASPSNLRFDLRPRIDNLSAVNGSLNGGTTIVITGDGFAALSSDNVFVWIGESACLVQSVSYQEVVCITSPAQPGTSMLHLTVNTVMAECNTDCSFTHSADLTAIVDDISPRNFSGPNTTIVIDGNGFDSDETSIPLVTIGGVVCSITMATGEMIECEVSYLPVGEQEVIVNIPGKGNAMFNTSDTVFSSPSITNVTPVVGSTEGGQVVSISGSGFAELDTVVAIGGLACIVQSVTLSEVTCVTQGHAADMLNLVVTSNDIEYPPVSYEYSSDITPVVSSVTPSQGVSGDTITIVGSSFSSDLSIITVTIDNLPCVVMNATPDNIVCDIGTHSAGTYPVIVHIAGIGLSSEDVQFEYQIAISSVSPIEGSFGGGSLMMIDGGGFDDTAAVTVCCNNCPISNVTLSSIQCEVPANSDSGSELTCNVTVTLSSGATATSDNAFTYLTSLTPVIDSVEPRRGGTAGGTTLSITGSGFLSSGNIVTIGGSPCAIQSETSTAITCETGSHSPSEMTKVRVEVGGNGIALQDNADYYYIDVWSSRYTWNNMDPPIEGDFVIIPAGQTILLDQSTPILKMLLIQGGTVIFDEVDLELHAENILIVDQGCLQVGSEEMPFQHQASIVMHGHVRSQELPLFGAKTLAVRNGTLDLHGIPVPITWTRLAETALSGSNQLTVEKGVTWNIGDDIVIASTGDRHSQHQNERVTLTDLSASGTVLTFEPALAYDHLGITQVIEGVQLEMRAEVGLLTHNVKFLGSVQEEWVETYEACPEVFDTNQFAVQTCFLGRFGEETGSDQFGAQIMLFAKEQNQNLVIGRIEYVEVAHAGQAFRLGRYPIHFHLNGDVNGSYVRGCGIHDTFNRAVTIHAVHNLLVEHNVAFNVMGHAYFMEDGIETGNIIQYNLGIFVRPSSSLLNVDITPATFWITNPDNIVRHNAAAGGSHFGFWYNMPVNPGGPSFTRSICPRNVPLGEFRNNSAHAQGWYGLWIFPTYHPRVGGGCDTGQDEPAKFYSLYAWETERGAEAVLGGAIQFHDFLISDTEKAGVEYQTVTATWGGSLIKNLVVVAYSNISSPSECTESGIKAPKSDGLIVDGATFVNFNQPGCAALQACSHCKSDQGGFAFRTAGLQFLSSTSKVAFRWEHECWIEDMDGTLSGTGGHIVLPSNPNLPPDHCSQDPEFSIGIAGCSCDDTVRLHRLAFNNPSPSSLLYKYALFSNAHGTSMIPYHKKRITHPEGWMLTLIDGDDYNFIFENVDHVTNISYNARFYNFDAGDYVLINHNFTQRPDKFVTIGEVKNSTEAVPTYDDDENGDWYFENDTRVLTYIVSGKGESEAVNRDINLNVYQCYFLDCLQPVPVPPPEGRPAEFRMWSEPESWEGVEEGWGGNLGNGVFDVPKDGDNVMIIPSVWMVADVALPVMNKLFIYGGLEIEDSRDNKLEATYILIQGGRLVIGFSEEKPFEHDMKILLNGNHFTPDQPLPNGPNLGSKALGVFGGLDLHGLTRSVYWTQLAATVLPNADMLTVVDQTDWVVGEEIVVAATSYEAWQTETFIIIEVIDPSTFKINGTFRFKHIAAFQADYTMSAEVGLLTRNLKIEGADYPKLFEESYGARVLVGRFLQSGSEYKGYASIANVEFIHTGQEGWPDSYDPRYSLAFLDAGEVDQFSPSKVKGCSFHNGFSTAIGVYGTQGLVVQDNVIHHTVGPAVIVRGNNNELIHNLVVLVIFPGTYQDRFEVENLQWTGGIEVENAGKVVLINNTVAGSERVTFKIKGEKCNEVANANTDWYGNVGHTTLHGIHMHLTSEPGCAKVANFLIYKSWDFGIYHQTISSIMMSGMTFVDNKMAILPIVYSPPAVSHQTSDKFVSLTNSLVVGVSEAFDCNTDNVAPENAGHSSGQRAPRAPGGGHIGFVWASFESGPNHGPFFSFHGISSYPTINGMSRLQDVTFRGFGTHCSQKDVAIATNPGSEDALHPLVTSGITLDDVSQSQLIFIHRPKLGSVNPSDCVDMDCDGLKKAMIRDLDGTLLGSEGTVIPQSEYEWNGDPRRGLGDYRIPKVMLTNTDGSRIPAEEKAPNKGIYRGDNNECTWVADWQAYRCHGIDHMMLVVESLDPDTEIRRLTPLAMYTEGYVDLINGPMDNGWCLGYTCQERISTLYTLIATGKSYEVYFTSTNPQTLRYHLLDAKEDQAVVLGLWYANPQRLDVYYQNYYISPTNADYSTGEFTWKAKDPSLPANQFDPSVTSNFYGENYFDRDTQTLWVLVKGAVPIEIRTTAVIMVTFGVPSVSIDNFYEENLIQNLVALLNVKPSQVRIVNVVSESSQRRRRAIEGQSEVTVEIGDEPALTIESFGMEVTLNQTDSNATTSAPPSETTPDSSTALDYDALVGLQMVMVDQLQSNELGNSLNITINSMLMTDPAPVVVDPTGGVRATNETGGSSDVPEGTKTYAELQLEEEEAAANNLVVEVEYRPPSSLVILMQPGGAIKGLAFGSQPVVYAVDGQGAIIPQLGLASNPWQLTVSVNPSSPGAGQLSGNVTVPFAGSWANFTDLAIDGTSANLVLDFEVSQPNTSSLTISSDAFDVAVRPLYLAAVAVPMVVVEGEGFDVIVELRDEFTMTIPQNLSDKGLDWKATIWLSMPANYRGQLLGQLEAIFDLDTASARFANLSIDVSGVRYKLAVTVTTTPTSTYAPLLNLDSFDVIASSPADYPGPVRRLSLRFPLNYDQVVLGKEDDLAISFQNHIGPRYDNVSIGNVSIERGSILIAFDVRGSVDEAQTAIWNDIISGSLSLEFNGYTLRADQYLLVDGQAYVEPSTEQPTPGVDPVVPFPVWAIILIVVVGVAVLLIVIMIIVKVFCRYGAKGSSVESMPLSQGDLKLKEFISSSSSLNPLIVEPDGIPFEAQCRSDTPPTTIRRTPEVQVTSLPPGFTEASGQQERLLEERVKMFIMVKNSDGTFQKLNSVQANRVGTVRSLRDDVKQALPASHRDKKFVLVDELMKDIDGAREKRAMLSEVYQSECVLLRWVNEQDMSKLCVCGLVGQFECSLCRQQTYCSPQCQSADWVHHSIKCSSYSVASVETNRI